MVQSAVFLMTDPAGYGVDYCINPWMRPDAWRLGGARLKARAAIASHALASALEQAGGRIIWRAAAAGAPDLVFPANAAVVLDGKVLLARFRHPERQGEEALFEETFRGLQAQGVVRELHRLPAGLFHEGAGDAIWDPVRGWFWAGWGQRSDAEAGAAVAEVFGRPLEPLQLRTPRFYHLDTCFCPLPGGEVLYHPPAFTRAALTAIRDRVADDDLIEADAADAAGFCVNAVAIGRTLVMARAPERLARVLGERGYRLVQVDLDPFILSGGGAYCMTLRLDRRSTAEEASDARHPAARALA